MCKCVKEIGCDRLQRACVYHAAFRIAKIECVGPPCRQFAGIRMPVSYQELGEKRCPLMFEEARIKGIRYPLRVLAFEYLARFA